MLPAYARSFDVGVAAASVVVSAFAFFRLLFAPASGALVHHLRKVAAGATREMSLDSVRGSSHIVAMARNVLGMQSVQTTAEMDENGPRKLWMMKTNTGRHPAPLGVCFEPHGDFPDIARLSYGDAPEQYRESSSIEKCQEWLIDLLSEEEEPLKPQLVIEYAQEQGFSRAMVYRARAALEGTVVSTAGRRDPNNKWGLSGHEGVDEV